MKIKKTIMLLCCVIIASMEIVLTGCGSISDESNSKKIAYSPYEGIWELTEAELDGVKVDDADALL